MIVAINSISLIPTILLAYGETGNLGALLCASPLVGLAGAGIGALAWQIRGKKKPVWMTAVPGGFAALITSFFFAVVSDSFLIDTFFALFFGGMVAAVAVGIVEFVLTPHALETITGHLTGRLGTTGNLASPPGTNNTQNQSTNQSVLPPGAWVSQNNPSPPGSNPLSTNAETIAVVVPRGNETATPPGGFASFAPGTARQEPGVAPTTNNAYNNAPVTLQAPSQGAVPTNQVGGAPRAQTPSGPLVRCPNCGVQTRAGVKFCQNCGATIGICPHCRKEVPPDSKICPNCGRELATKALVEVEGSGTLVLQNRYRLDKMLGKGGMGAVYRASDLRLNNKTWAIKEMTDAHHDPLERASAIEAFRHEANLLASLDHPNLPKIVDYFSDRGNQYLVMDFIDGTTLEERLRENGKVLPEDLVLEWSAQLCDVLYYIHAQDPQIIFRDLKPANIMIVQRDGRIKLIDFGIARLFKPGQGQDTTAFGSVGYSPPEQYGKGQTDVRSDLYALAATLHRLLTKHDPSSTPFRFPPVRSLNPEVSIRTEEALATALDIDPAKRFASAAEMRAALIS